MSKRSRKKQRHPPPADPSSPTHLLTNSILIQTDDGRRFDSSIQYNRIIDDPFQRRKSKYSLRTIMALIVTITVFTYLLVSESMGFSSLPLAVTDRKYLGRKPNVGNNSTDNSKLSSRTSNHNVTANLELTDDDTDDELRGTDDDDIGTENSFENNPEGDGTDRLGETGYSITRVVDNEFSAESIESNYDGNTHDSYKSTNVGSTGENDAGPFENEESNAGSYLNVISGGTDFDNTILDVDSDPLVESTQNNETMDGADSFADSDDHIPLQDEDYNQSSAIGSMENDSGHDHINVTLSSFGNYTMSEEGSDAALAENLNENGFSNNGDFQADEKNSSISKNDSSKRKWPW